MKEVVPVTTGLEYRTWDHSKKYNCFFDCFLCSQMRSCSTPKKAFYCDRMQSLFSILPEPSTENVTFICDFIVLGSIIPFLPPLCCMNFRIYYVLIQCLNQSKYHHYQGKSRKTFFKNIQSLRGDAAYAIPFKRI